MIQKYIRKFKKVFADMSNKNNVKISTANKIVSFTFDDIPLSGLKNGSRLLEKHGKKGTFYFAMSFMKGMSGNEDFYSAEDVKECIGKGHEAACHTYSHMHFYDTGSKKTIVQDLAKNQRTLKELNLNVEFQNFSYPYGEQTMKAKSAAAEFYMTSRSCDHGVNVDLVDLNNLKSVRLYEKVNSVERLSGIIEDFSKNGGWLILYTHDVQSDYTQYGCSEEYLDSIIKKCVDLNLDILPVKEALERISL